MIGTLKDRQESTIRIWILSGKFINVYYKTSNIIIKWRAKKMLCCFSPPDSFVFPSFFLQQPYQVPKATSALQIKYRPERSWSSKQKIWNCIHSSDSKVFVLSTLPSYSLTLLLNFLTVPITRWTQNRYPATITYW